MIVSIFLKDEFQPNRIKKDQWAAGVPLTWQVSYSLL